MFGNKRKIEELDTKVYLLKNRVTNLETELDYYIDLCETLRKDLDKARGVEGDVNLESTKGAISSEKRIKGLNIVDDNDNFFYYEFRELMNLKSEVESDRYAKLCIFLTVTACNQNSYLKQYGDNDVNYFYIHENQLRKIFYNSVDSNLDLLEQYGIIERLPKKDTEGKIYIKTLNLTTITNAIPMELKRAEGIFKSMTGRGHNNEN